jgi:pilus assembly protein CpaC
VQIGGVATPALRVRRTDTTIELGDGESFVISGLISSSANDSIDKVPWLGDLPVLGALFRSARINKEARELIMVVTPNLVRPLSRQAQLPPLPGARERQRQPNFAETFFLETGDFSTGYSD